MRILFFSDVHGVPAALERLWAWEEKWHPEQLVLLGDALYHGPRNGVPHDYDCQRTAELLNSRRDRILAVRGNCDSEVDQMLLQFPILSDFSELIADGRRFFLSHGHRWNEERLPPVPDGTVLVHGHTHIPLQRDLPEQRLSVFNPGSISLPKGGFPPTFGFWDGARLTVRLLENDEELPLTCR